MSLSVLFHFRVIRRAYVQPMIYETGLIHRLRGVTRLHAVAHANTINHGEYELGTRHGVPFETGRTSRANVCSFSRTSRLSCIPWSMILQWQSLLAVNRCDVVLQLRDEESIRWVRSTSYVRSHFGERNVKPDQRDRAFSRHIDDEKREI